jgi:putative membrane-bound dehydrogenase-like protein
MIKGNALRSAVGLVGIVLLLAGGRWAEVAEPPTDSADRDYSRELPRIAPKEPAEALKTFHVAAGFRIEQVAAEPLVVDPIAMSFDENGRLFVIEMRDYSEDETANLGRVRLLVDTDGDGRFDKSTIYADGLSWPTAIACYDGGVFVGAPPEMFYFKDTKGDGVADVRKLVFSGFGRSNVQGMMNTLAWGLDNRIHGATSSSGADVRGQRSEVGGQRSEVRDQRSEVRDQRSAVGGQGAETNEQPVVLRGRDFAFDPRTLAIEPTSGGAQHGMSFDAWGRKFVCSNSDHIQMVMYEDRYVARNPYLAAPSPRVSIAADGPQAEVFRTSPVEPWRIVRTRLRVQGIVPGPVEGGGRAAGYFTGATGATIYRGNAWPREYQGWAMVGDVGSNLVHRKRLDPNGVGFIARRVDEKSEFVTSDDIWFRPVQFTNAPDGCLYIADMYREVIEHPKSLAPVIKKHLDLTSGRDRGRIYRIVPEGFQQPKMPQLGKAITAELVATLAHANGWHRETAARLLYERQDRSAIPLLEELAQGRSPVSPPQVPLPEGRMHALYALDGLEALSPGVILIALDDKDPHVREHAVRLAERVATDSPAVRDKLYALVSDDNLRVRYQLAFTLGQLSGPQRNTALAAIARRDVGDRWLRLAVHSSLAEGSGAVLAELSADKQFRETSAGRDFLQSLATQIGKQQRSDDVAAVLGVLRALPAEEKTVVQAIVQGLAAKQGSLLEQQIAAATGGRADALTKELTAAAAAKAVDTKLKVADRVSAIALLRLGNFADQEKLFATLLEPTQSAEVQAAALDTLAAFDSPPVAALLIERWPVLSPRLRSRAADVLFSRGPWVSQLLDAVDSGRIAVADLEPGRLKLVASGSDEQVRQKAEALLSKLELTRRTDVLDAYRGVLETKGDAVRGKEVFKKVCAACHRLEGVGHEIAPNLAAMRNRGPDAMLLNVLDPNREVNPQYLNYALVTTDGRILTGMIAAETATSVTLQRPDNATDTVLRIDIDQLRSTGLSLMPEGMEKQIDLQAMADLIEYLRAVE